MPVKKSLAAFTLIELLVTTVIFSVGMLAVAGLQTVSKRANYESLQRTTASHVAYGLLEDMRANAGAIATYTAGGSALGGTTITSEPAPNCDTVANTCSAAQLAAHDLWVWEQALDGAAETIGTTNSGGINYPTMCITGPAGGVAGVYTVTIAWRGTVAITDAGLSTCGAASGNYGANNEFRRMLQVPTYLDPGI